MAFRAPFCLACSHSSSRAARCPEITTWPGELKFTASTMPCALEFASQSSINLSSSIPITAAIPPMPGATASDISCALFCTSSTARRNGIASAAVKAAYSPKLCPAITTGCGKPSSRQTRHTAMSPTNTKGWVIAVSRCCSSLPFCAMSHRS